MKLNPGIDYIIDYIRGVINFKKSINSNYIIAVDYETKSGARLKNMYGTKGKYVLIKDEREDVSITGAQELESYYSIGNTSLVRGIFGEDIIIQVRDANQQLDLNYANLYDKIEIDYNAGIFWFKKDRPFDPSVYLKNNAVSVNTIHIEYFHKIKTFMLRPSLVVGSERIVAKGQILVKDVDYMIDYDIGLVTFFNDSYLDNNADIEIAYEYMPFGGRYQQTLLGLRGSYTTEKASIGTTLLYSSADRPRDAPNITSTPASVSIIDTDMSLTLDPKWTAIKTTISGEIARSVRNPNTFGKAIIENMEGINEEDIVPLHKDMWQISSNPNTVPLDNPEKIKWDNEDINIKDIDPNTVSEIEEKRQVLKVNFSDIAPNTQASIVSVLGKDGRDYSRKEYMEFYVYSSQVTNANIIMRYGGIDEDADGSGGFSLAKGIWKIGDPKTEDLNGDDKLAIDEDTGWEYVNGANTYFIGKDNGKLDSQDLNKDGYLNLDDGMGATYGTSIYVKPLIDEDGITHETVDWTGWKKFIIPLEIGGAGGSASNWTSIKHFRLTINNPNTNTQNISGELKFYGISAINTKWEKGVVEPAGSTGVLKVRAISSNDPGYDNTLVDTDDYLALYSLPDEDEQALLLDYSNFSVGVKGYTKYIMPKQISFVDYKKLSFFVYGDENNEDFFIQFGADDSNYFEYSTKITWKGWKRIDIGDKNGNGLSDDFTSFTGAPKLNVIKQLKIGLKNNTSSDITGKIFVNEIFLSDVKKKQGMAYKGQVSFLLPGWFTLSNGYKKIESTFETINSGGNEGIVGTSSITSGRQIENINSKFNFQRIKFMPISASVNYDEIFTPAAEETRYSVQEEGLVINKSGSVSTSLIIKNLPTLSASYGRGIIDTRDQDKIDESDSYTGSLSYSIPGSFIIKPDTINLGYSRVNAFTYYTVENTTTTITDKWTIEDNYSASTSWSVLNRIQITPTYNLSYIREEIITKFAQTLDLKDDSFMYDRSKIQAVKGAMNMRIFKWLVPNVSYDVNISENYDVLTTTETASNLKVDTKELQRTASGAASLSLDMHSIVPKFTPFSTLNFSGSYGIQDGDTWKNVPKDFETLDKLFIRTDTLEELVDEGATRQLLSFKDNRNLISKWKPLGFIGFGGMLKTMKTFTTTIAYSDIQEDVEETGTSRFIFTQIWPDVTVSFNDIEYLFLIPKYMRDTDLIVRYLYKFVETFEISEARSLSRSYTYRFKLLNKFDWSLNYGDDNSTDYNYSEAKIVTENISQSWGAQVGMQFGAWRITPKYNGSKADVFNAKRERTTDTLQQSGAIQFHADYNKPTNWRIPLFGMLRFSNRIIFDSEIKALFERSPIELEMNKNIYTLTLSSDYDLTSNFKITLGAKFMKAEYIKRSEDDYYGYEINATMSLIF